MQIQGPLIISVIDNANNTGRELHIKFSDEFQQKDLAERISDFKEHINSLHQDINKTDDPASQQGMLTIAQISEQILPHIESDEIPLEETIIIEIGQTSPFDDLLNKATL